MVESARAVWPTRERTSQTPRQCIRLALQQWGTCNAVGEATPARLACYPAARLLPSSPPAAKTPTGEERTRMG